MPEEMKVNETRTAVENEIGLAKASRVTTVEAKPVKARTGVASDLFEIADTGKPKSKKVRQLCKEGDSVDRMAKSTAELLSQTTTVALKELERIQRDKLDVLSDRHYAPRTAKIVDPTADLRKVMGDIRKF